MMGVYYCDKCGLGYRHLETCAACGDLLCDACGQKVPRVKYGHVCDDFCAEVARLEHDERIGEEKSRRGTAQRREKREGAWQ